MVVVKRRGRISRYVLNHLLWVYHERDALILVIYVIADVKELVNECVGGSELQQRKAKIQSFSDQTSSKLKKHVYDNYMQFIETAKEISRKAIQ